MSETPVSVTTSRRYGCRPLTALTGDFPTDEAPATNT
jgi:hypothetical protein